MFVSVIATTRNASIAVRTLHTLLNLNIISIQSNNRVEINFIKDDQVEKNKVLIKKAKTADRILVLDYGISLDTESLKKVFSVFGQHYSLQVFPCVVENIDWDMFKSKLSNKSKEPIEQMGLNFDTEVTKKLSDDDYIVKSTSARAWVVESKHFLKCVKDKKGEPVKLPNTNTEFFEKLLSRGLKTFAFTAAKPTISYQHECIGNILESANVNKGYAR